MKKSIRLSAFVILCLTLAAIPAYSEEPIEFQSVEVSANKLKTTAQKYAASVTIITEEEIKQSGSPLVENILLDQKSASAFSSKGLSV